MLSYTQIHMVLMIFHHFSICVPNKNSPFFAAESVDSDAVRGHGKAGPISEMDGSGGSLGMWLGRPDDGGVEEHRGWGPCPKTAFSCLKKWLNFMVYGRYNYR